MKYSKENTIKAFQRALSQDPAMLYNARCVNWIGGTSDHNSNYSEIIVKELLKEENFRKLKSIQRIRRPQTYNPSRDRLKNVRGSNRREEHFARALFRKELTTLGEVLNYQIPLKDKRDRMAGKIDMVSRGTHCVYLIELKGPENNETLLRAVLEIWTYSKQLDEERFLESYDLPPSTPIKPVVLLLPQTRACSEAWDLKKRPLTHRLIQKLGVSLFGFDAKKIL